MNRFLRRAYMVVGVAVWVGSLLPWVPLWVTVLGAVTFCAGWYWGK